MSIVVPLHFGVDGAKHIRFAPLTGRDEADAPGAIALLGRLSLAGNGYVAGDAVARLTLGDRDRALAGLYANLYGWGIQADARCGACEATYEIGFDLSALRDSRQPDGTATGTPLSVPVGDARLRLPTQADMAGGPDGFVARLLIDGPEPTVEDAATALEAADPALTLDLSGTCPECNATQAVPFAIDAFLQATLARDRAFLMREVHLIASAYRWSLPDILGLSRADRQGFARLLIAEREAAATPVRRAS